jgi:predicted dehydrogenase
MSEPMNRRHFLGAATSTGLALGLRAARAAEPGAAGKVVVGVIGTGGRGTMQARTFENQPGVAVAYVCDVDPHRAGMAADLVGKIHGRTVKAVGDFRRILDDKAVDAVVIATCNHWHAPAAILACAAGKHVYVEQPGSHNPREGELMVEAARKYDRRVQMGNQRRSWPKVMEAIQQVRDGAVGRAYFAQAWYTNNRPSIGRGKPAPVPEGLDYDRWQGPAPRRPFRHNYLHYNWHWFWHWGNGELGNNGVHMIDICRWGLGVDLPTHVSSAGGRYRFEDDQETPDTLVVTYTFEGRKAISWQGLSCNQLPGGQPADVIFHGETGSLAIRGDSYTVFDPKGKEVRKVSSPVGEEAHVANFLEAVRGGGKLNSAIEESHKSTLLCHLGNIAYRVGRALRCDPASGHVLDDKQAMALWAREYEKGWEPKV